MRAWACVALLLIGGCRARERPPIDPNRPDALAPCPAGLHLSVALATRDYEATQTLLRFAPGSYAQCQGAQLPKTEYGNVTTVGGLPDGTELVGFAGDYGYGGSLVRVVGTAVTARLDDPDFYPISIAPLAFNGEDAVAVAWGSGSSSSDSGERIDVFRASDLTQLGSWDASYQAIRVAAPPTGQGARLAVLLLGDGLQEMRADPGATTLATTGELQVTMPFVSGTLRSLDVFSGVVRASGDDGVMYWSSAAGNAFLGPVSCRWPDVTDSPLPADGSDYIGALIDATDPDDRTIALVSGELEGSGTSATHVFTLRHRGECELLFSIPDTHAAVAIAWAGR